MTSYLIKIYKDEVTIDYDEVKSTLLIDDEKTINLKKEEAHMLDVLEINFNKKHTKESWNMLENFLIETVKFRYKKI